jgi:thiosulfate/3-mercaptopyruvate sulfurtransferase
MVAARLWWMLRWLGHLPVAVLDGGWDRWVAEEGRGARAQVPRPTRSLPGKAERDPRERHSLRSHLGDGTMVLVDGRAPDRYRSQNETIDPVGGRYPERAIASIATTSTRAAGSRRLKL